jgi:hypothetical protein
VRDYFTKLRSNVRTFMQRMQRKASVDGGAAKAAVATEQLAVPLKAPFGQVFGQAAQSLTAMQPRPLSDMIAGASPPTAQQHAAAPASSSHHAPAQDLAGGPALAMGSAGAESFPPAGAPGVPSQQGPWQVADGAAPCQQALATPPRASALAAAGAAVTFQSAVSPGAELRRLDAARESGLAELRRFLDPVGGIHASKIAGMVQSDRKLLSAHMTCS